MSPAAPALSPPCGLPRHSGPGHRAGGVSVQPADVGAATKIEILGTGCAKCKLLAERAEEAAKNLGAAYTLVKVSEYPDIVARGVMSTPGLVVDGVVKSQGHVPTVAAIQELLR